MKKVRLYDFSIWAVMAAAIVFPFLIYLCISMFVNEHLIFYGILLPFVLAGLGFLIYLFVIKAPILDQKGVRYKSIFIPRDKLQVLSEYDVRFKEAAYYLRDLDKDYRGLCGKELAAIEIRVQATLANTRKLTEYTRLTLSPAPKPKRRWKA